MAKDVIDLITTDHRNVEKLFEQLKSGGGNRSALVDEVAKMLIAHSKAEEERVYPVVAKEASGEKDEVRHSEEEHQEAEKLIRRLQATDPREKEFGKLVDELVEAVAHHVETEESEVLPALRGAVDSSRLAELADQFSQRKEEVLRETDAGGRTADDLTKDELYREAREADVPGRSKMAKDELAESIQQQSDRGT